MNPNRKEGLAAMLSALRFQKLMMHGAVGKTSLNILYDKLVL